MALEFDLKVLGSRELENKLGALPMRAQNRVMKRVLRATVARLQNEVLLNLSGRVVDERTGRLVNAIEAQKPKVVRNNERGLVMGLRLPARGELGIDAKAKGYYPTALEYDVRLGPLMPIRKAVNAVAEDALDRMAGQIAEGIEKEWSLGRTFREAI